MKSDMISDLTSDMTSKMASKITYKMTYKMISKRTSDDIFFLHNPSSVFYKGNHGQNDLKKCVFFQVCTSDMTLQNAGEF